MFKKKLLFPAVFLLFLFISCSDKSTDSEEVTTGTLIFKSVNTLPKLPAGSENSISTDVDNSMSGTIMHTLNLKLAVTEIWISQDEFSAGGKDNLSWIKIGEGNELKNFDEYTFTAEEIPAGVYKSIKITFKNIFYRLACYQSDHSNIMTMKERMGDWIGDCTDEEALAPINYFNSSGNHNLSGETFISVNPKEKLTGFEIKPGKITKLYWKLGDERPWDPYACSFEWIDENNNGVWDCGIDRMDNFNCNMNPPLETMWIFIAEYE